MKYLLPSIFFILGFTKYSQTFCQSIPKGNIQYKEGMDLARMENQKGIFTYFTPIKETSKYKYYLPILKEKLNDKKIVLWAQEKSEEEDLSKKTDLYKGYKAVMDSAITANFGKDYIKNLHKECKAVLKTYVADSAEARFRMCYNLNHHKSECLKCDIQDTIYSLLTADTLEGLVFGEELFAHTTLFIDLKLNNTGMITDVIVRTNYVGKDIDETTLKNIKIYVGKILLGNLQLEPCMIGKKKLGTIIYNNKIRVALRSRQKYN